MTVDLLITKIDGPLIGAPDDCSVYVPIATSETFRKWWEPGIKAIGAKWMEMFSWGIDIDFESLPEVIMELRQFRHWLGSIDDVEMREFLYGRVDRLIDTLATHVENNRTDYEYNFG